MYVFLTVEHLKLQYYCHKCEIVNLRGIEQELDVGRSSSASSGLQAYGKTSTVK